MAEAATDLGERSGDDAASVDPPAAGDLVPARDGIARTTGRALRDRAIRADLLGPVCGGGAGPALCRRRGRAVRQAPGDGGEPGPVRDRPAFGCDRPGSG